MRTLSRVALTADHIEPLDAVFPPFKAHGIEIQPEAITMFAGTPASGKSFLTLKWIQMLGLPTLYFSADTSLRDQIVRAAAIATGHDQHDVRVAMQNGGEDFYADILAEKFSHIRWVNESDPTYEDLELETAAYAEAYGRFPAIIVCDNLVNFIGDGDGEYASQKETTRVMNRLVRITKCSLWLLHHMNEKKDTPNYPSPRKDIANKLAQIPAYVLSIAGDDAEGLIRVAIVKARTDKQDPSGANYATLYTDLATGQFFASRQAREVGHGIH